MFFNKTGGRLLFVFLFAVAAAKFFLELLDATQRVNKLLLAGVERVGFARNVNEVNRVLVAVFPLNSVFGANRRASQNGVIGLVVFEDNGAIVGMDIRLHGITGLLAVGR